MEYDARAISTGEKRLDDDYLAKFKKMKGATLSPMGFWYRVDCAGNSELVKDAVIDMVVKKTLTDNTVIQDMDLIVTTAFREAISLHPEPRFTDSGDSANTGLGWRPMLPWSIRYVLTIAMHRNKPPR